MKTESLQTKWTPASFLDQKEKPLGAKWKELVKSLICTRVKLCLEGSAIKDQPK